MIFVTHDLGIVARICDRVAVMYAGRIVETGPVRAALRRARRIPYTRALLASMPAPRHAAPTRLTAIEGQPPDLARPAAGLRASRRAARTSSSAAGGGAARDVRRRRRAR